MKNGGYLDALKHFEVTATEATESGLPTRHVTLCTGGGLRFPSQKYFDVFEMVEDRFFGRTILGKVFALPNVDIIRQISDDLLSDATMLEKFLSIMPSNLHDIGRQLYQMFVKRVATLHGTELANQLMEGLAAQKRRSVITKGTLTHTRARAHTHTHTHKYKQETREKKLACRPL